MKLEKIDRHELLRVAALAKLDLGRSERELEDNLREINATKEGILDKILEIGIDEADVERVTAAEPYGRAQALRDDVAVPSLTRVEVLAGAGGNTEAGCVCVPRITAGREA